MNYTRNWRLTLIFLKVVVYYNFGDDLSVYIFYSVDTVYFYRNKLNESVAWI